MTEKRKKGLKKALLYLLVAALWMALWQLLASLINQALLFPGPIAVLKRLTELCATAAFYQTVPASLLRVFVGMLCGTFCGLLGGFLTALFRPLRAFFAPMLAVLKATPVASFILLLVLWVSRDLTPALISGMMVLPVVWENTESGILHTDKHLIELAKAYGMSRLTKLRRLYLPSLAPFLFASLRASLGLSWKAGIAAEVLLLPLISVGKQIYESKQLLETTDLFAWTAVVILFSILIEKTTVTLLARLQKRKAGAAND